MNAPRCPICKERMLRSPEKHGGNVLLWWCAGIDKNLRMHNLTITEIKGVMTCTTQ